MQVVDINGTDREVQSVGPDPTYPGFIRLEFRRHHEWMTYDEFLQFNPKLKDLIKNRPEPPKDVVGVVTTATKNTLKDSTQNFAPNAYLGMWVWISRGKGEGQKRTVVKNTKNTITLDKDWEVKPDKTSQYVISYNVQSSVHAMGNTLPLVDMKSLEKRAIKMEKDHGRLSSDYLKKNIKYLKPEEM